MIDQEARERIAKVEGIIEEFRTQFSDLKSLLRLILAALGGIWVTVVAGIVLALLTK